MTLPAELAPTAPELAKVDHLLKARAMAPYLAHTLDCPAGPCHVLDAKYQPGQRCTVLYALGPALVTGVLRLDETAAPPRWWRFPDDPALPGLRVLTDSAALTGALREALPRRPPLRGARATLLRYRPHRRATFLVRAWSGPHLVRFVAKAYHDAGKAAAVFAETRRLGARLGAGPTAVTLARPLAYLPGPRLVLQEVVGGRPLDQVLGDCRGVGHGLPAALGSAAAALAAVHAAPPVSARERPVAAELARFHRRAAAAATVRPGLACRMRAVCTELDRRADDLPKARALVHGDGKPSQFLLSPAGITLLDFDHCGLADPASDVGTFLAALRHRAIVGAAPGAHRLPAAFLGAYQAAAGPGITTAARWYEAVALVRKALRAFARSPRSPLPAALVEAARQVLSEEVTAR